jgi:sigma-B regulation protein RsbU (phosphoserine phosphatase)
LTQTDPTPLLHVLEPEQIDSLLASCERRHLVDGEFLLEPGQENHHLYLLLRGGMKAFLSREVGAAGFDIGPGECIGEMSMVDGRPVSALVVSTGVNELLVVPGELFWEHLAGQPGVARNLLRLMSSRMRENHRVVTHALEQQLAMEHLRRELATAGTIQMSMLPHHRPLISRHPELDLHALLTPAKEVGGDLYDALALDDDRILLAVGDVSGKGMPAALFMMRTLTLLHTQAMAGRPADELLPTLNRLLCENNETDMFVTLYVAIVDLVSGHVSLLNGGHNPPLLARGDGPFTLLDQARGALLGVLPNARYQLAELHLTPGDRLLLYTDGITEAESPDRDWFGLDRARAALDAHAPAAPMDELLNALSLAVTDFVAEAAQSDDITMLGFRFPG